MDKQGRQSDTIWDNRLKKVLIQLSNKSIDSQEYRANIKILLAIFPFLPGIKQDKHPNYHQAVEKTAEYIEINLYEWLSKKYLQNNNLDQVSATKLREHFVNWVNFILNFKICDLYRHACAPLQKPILSLNNLINQDTNTSLLEIISDPKTCDDYLNEQENELQRCVFKRYIECDPEKKLRDAYASGCIECNCQRLALQKLSRSTNKGASFSALARELSISSNIYSHWERTCLPILQEVYDNYEEYYQKYSYLLDDKVPLSKWLSDVVDSAWHSLEFLLQNAPSACMARTPLVGCWKTKQIDLPTKEVETSVFLVANVSSQQDDRIRIIIRVYSITQYVPYQLELAILDELGGALLQAKARNTDNYIQLAFTGAQSDVFSVQLSLQDVSVKEDFVI